MTAHDHGRRAGAARVNPLAPGLDPARTALVLIGLARTFRGAGAPVVAVRVRRAGVPDQPPGSDLVAEVAEAADLVVVKHTIGAFQDTGLHDMLRERGVRTLVLAGIATNLGVESTARAAADLGYDLVFAADAMSGLTAAEHEASVTLDFPRLGTVVASAEVEFTAG
jgi:nicotinamidase-related amidase